MEIWSCKIKSKCLDMAHGILASLPTMPTLHSSQIFCCFPNTLGFFSLFFSCSWCSFPPGSLFLFALLEKNTQFKCHHETFLKFSMEIALFLHINITWVNMLLLQLLQQRRIIYIFVSLLSCELLQKSDNFLYYHYLARYLVYFGCLAYYLNEWLHEWLHEWSN